MTDIPVLPVAGLNIEEKNKEFLKSMMLNAMNGVVVPCNIEIIPDPTNPFDSNAIKILLNGTQIGFIAKVDQHNFDFNKFRYVASIVSWGVLKDGSVYMHLQPAIYSKIN